MNQKILNLIIAETNGNIDREGLVELNSWKNESNKNKELYDRWRRMCLKTDLSLKWDTINMNASKFKFKSKISDKKGYKAYYQLAAAFIALLITISGVIYFINYKDNNQHRFAEILPADARAVLTLSDGRTINLGDSSIRIDEKISGIKINDNHNGIIKYESRPELKNTEILFNNLEIKRGQTYKLALSDGSRVQFNSESSLSYPVIFTGNTREVHLKGEAFFDIAHNPDKPFFINTEKSRIKVEGTSFNVKVYEGENEEITLVSGKVNVEIGEESYSLNPGQQISINTTTDEIILNDVDVDLYTSWKEGVFKFVDLPMADIVNVLSRWYDVEFDFENEILKEERYSGAITKYRSLDYILNIIEKTNDLKFYYDYDKIIIKEK